jgi:hypothetical protein
MATEAMAALPGFARSGTFSGPESTVTGSLAES